MAEIRDLTVNTYSLAACASQLKVTVEVSPDALRAELAPYLDGMATLQVMADDLDVDSEETNQLCIDLLNRAAEKQQGFTRIWERYKKPLNLARATILDLERETAGAADKIRKQLAEKSARFLLDMDRAKRHAEAGLATLAAQERVRLAKVAEELMMEGDVAAAQSKLNEAAMVVAPTLPEAVPITVGARITPKYRGFCHDTIAVLKAIVDGKLPLVQTVKLGDVRPLVVIDQVVLNAMVSRLGPDLKIPGITVEPDFQVASRRARQ